jgi:hypothetical protein
LGLIAWCAPGAAASATSSTNSNFGLMTYSTTGNINYAQGVQGNNVISYISLQDAVSDPSSNVDLGYFKVAPNAPGVTTTYTNTPFSIVVQPSAYSGHDLTNPGTVTLNGQLNGTVNGSSQSSVEATFNSTGNGAFTLSSGSAPDSTLSMLQDQKVLLVPSTTGLTALTPGGLTSVETKVVSTASPDVAPVPEPSTIALFLSTVGGLGLRRFVMTRRPRAAA